MADPGLQKSLTDAENAIAELKAKLQASQQQLEAADGEQAQATFSQAIAELEAACDKVKQGIAPAPPQAPPMTATGSDDVIAQVEPVANAGPEEAPRRSGAAEKLIEVPVRQRTGQPRPAAAPAPRSFTMELPATPFNPRSAAGDQAPPTGQPAPTPGFPADTPMAAEVLASLGALGLQLGGVAAAGARAPAPRAPRHVSVQSAAAELPLGRRAAAVRAAEASAALVPRPRPNKRDAAAPPPGTVLLPEARPPASRFKTCNCKRSQCLKLYCECFAGGGYCLPGCQCFNCLNTVTDAAAVDAARASILAKNPRAFNAKVTGDTHKKGCRCKRSKCLKKYCECFNAGVKCNPEVCQCEGCHNMQLGDPGNDEAGEEALPWGGAGEEEGQGAEAPGGQGGKAPAPAAVETNENAGINAALAAPLASISAALAGAAGGAPWADPAAAAAATAAIMAAAMAQPAAPAPAAPDAGQQQHPDALALLMQQIAGQQAPPPPQQQQQQQVEEAVPKVVSAPAPAAFVTPGGGGAAAGPSALTSSHLSDVVADVHDTATSPAGAAGAAQKERRVATMTAAAKAMGAAAKGAPAPAEGGEGSQVRGKRPRRAASGGVQGAVAAATSDWGLASPPPKRASSVPSAAEPGRGTAAAARGALLRRALQNEAAAAGGTPGAAPAAQPRAGDEADAVSVLVSLNNGP